MVKPRSRLFDDAEPVDKDLSSYLADGFDEMDPVEADTYDIDAWEQYVDADADAAHPATWLLSRPAYRKLLGWCISELNSEKPTQKFQSKAAIAEHVGVSRQAVSPRIPELAEIGIFDTKGNKRTRYRINTDSEILTMLVALDRAVAGAFTRR